jgi:hypothetical protein
MHYEYKVDGRIWIEIKNSADMYLQNFQMCIYDHKIYKKENTCIWDFKEKNCKSN